MHLTNHELATVLAALRLWQRSRHPLDLEEIATDEGALDPLDTDEIDSLCERINCEGGDNG